MQRKCTNVEKLNSRQTKNRITHNDKKNLGVQNYTKRWVKDPAKRGQSDGRQAPGGGGTMTKPQQENCQKKQNK